MLFRVHNEKEDYVGESNEVKSMKYMFLFIILPAGISFLGQSVLCRRVKKGMFRHAALIFSLIAIVFGVIALLTQSGGTFGALGVLAACLYFLAAFCALCGYGAAWIIYLAMRKYVKEECKEQ